MPPSFEVRFFVPIQLSYISLPSSHFLNPKIINLSKNLKFYPIDAEASFFLGRSITYPMKKRPDKSHVVDLLGRVVVILQIQ